ncbi:hypothetical protein PS1_019335 [Malus domestica]
MAGGSPKADLEELGTRFGTNLILSEKEHGGVCIERKDVESALLGFQYTLIAEVLTTKLGHPTRICKETLDERTGPEDCPKTRNEAFAFRGLDAVLNLRGNPLGSGSKSRASSGSNGGRSGSERWNDERNDEPGGGRRSGRSSTTAGMGCQPQQFASRSQNGSE